MPAKVLIYDIETSPLIGYTWSTWQTDVIKVIQDYQILSVAWKWLGEKPVYVLGQDDFGDYNPGKLNDRSVVEHIHGLFDIADIVIAHNGDSFDQKKSQARMIIHGMKPPSPYKQLDTKKLAKRYAAFTSNRLGHLAKDFRVAQKGSPGGFETWEGCMAGDPKAWARMKRYNKQDIPPLEDIYKTLLPWIDNHPAMNILNERPDACPKCGKGPLQARGTRKTTKVATIQRLQCQSCFGWCSARKSDKTEVKYVN